MQLSKLFAILLSVTIGAACTSEPEKATKAAKAALEKSLRDPSSAQYRDVQTYSEGVVCGEYNAKNSYGGYVGFKQFTYSKGAIDTAEKDSSWLCSNSPEKYSQAADRKRKADFNINAEECARAKAAAVGKAAPPGGMTKEQLRAKVACDEQ